MSDSDQVELLCEFWEEEPPESSPHSRLYHLEPIGIGTSFVESLTSYVTRLAEAHSMYPRVLIVREILPFLQQYRSRLSYQDEAYITLHVLQIYWNQSPRLNGVANAASDLIQALEQLTLRHDLRFLTLPAWQTTLPVHRSLRRDRAWCPACFEDWRESNHPIYDPLLWAIADVKICPDHHLQLQTHCPAPRCGRSMPPLTQRAQPGHCAFCQTWLGGSWQYQTQDHGMPQSEEWHHQKWIANTLGEWLADSPNLTPPSHEQITNTIAQYVNIYTQGNKEAFSRQIHVPKHAVPQWLNSSNMPMLDSLLQMCFYTNISLIDFLRGKIPEPATSETKVSESKPTILQNRKPKVFESQKVKDALEAALQETASKPASLKKLAQSLGYDISTIKKHYPDLSLALQKRYREAIKQRHTQEEKRKLERREEKKLAHGTIRSTLEAALEITEGTPVSLKKIAQQVGHSMAYLQKHFPDHCQAIVSQYEGFLRERGRIHLQQLRNEAQSTVLELHKQGRYPSNDQIGKMLQHPGMLRNPHVREAVLETKRALGLGS